MPYGTVNADKITTSDGVSSAGLYGFKNKIFNGAMVIDQRNAGASVTPTTDGQYGSCDRWNYWLSQTSKFSVQQSSTAPVGFSSSLLITSLSSYSVTGNDYFSVNQKIEGFNFADMMWGTANAQTVTLSFWVRSSLTGTFGGAFTNSATNRSYPFTYTISVANTWEQKSVTIAGDTTGTWVGSTNGIGAIVQFGLGAVAARSGTAGSWSGAWYVSATGATSVVGTNGATFYITGVQLEKGSTATSFDYRPYGTELQLCQRYYYKISNHPIGGAYSANYSWSNGVVSFPATMRSTPTLDSGAAFTVGAGSAGTVALTNTPTGVNSPSAVGLYNSAGNWTATVFITIAAGFSAEL